MTLERKLFIDGGWHDGSDTFTVANKYTGEAIATVHRADDAIVDRAVQAAAKAAVKMAEMPRHERCAILRKTAWLIQEHGEELARTIAAESGKALKFAKIEVDRAFDTFVVASEEARRLAGEEVPLDGSQAGVGFFGYCRRRPVGVVGAISPFNFPLNLVAHKVAPALAGGNAVVLKAADLTPLTAIRLGELLQEAGLPDGAINLVHGPGSEVGQALVKHPLVRKVTFTGSDVVGEKITKAAGLKKVTMELGNSSPVIVAPDADLELLAKRLAVGAFYNSGQVCISVQRVYAERDVADAVNEAFVAETKKLKVGDPLEADTDVGPMIELKHAQRIEQWVGEATEAGATMLIGGQREDAVYWPTVLRDPDADTKIVKEEAFGPVAATMTCDSFEAALQQADATQYGLQASIFTRDIDRILDATDRLHFGGIVVNDTPNFRVDLMPYGGMKRSGFGREGLKYAIQEMTELQMVAIRRHTTPTV